MTRIAYRYILHLFAEEQHIPRKTRGSCNGTYGTKNRTNSNKKFQKDMYKLLNN